MKSFNEVMKIRDEPQDPPCEEECIPNTKGK